VVHVILKKFLESLLVWMQLRLSVVKFVVDVTAFNELAVELGEFIPIRRFTCVVLFL